MSGAFCPSCGVAVVPGYVRCPKCHQPLPRMRIGPAVAEGGTAVSQPRKGSTLALIAVGVVGAGVIAYLGLRGGDDGRPAAAPAPEAPAAPDEGNDDRDEVNPPPAPDSPTPAEIAARAAASAAAELERALRRERLWSTVSVTGDRVDVRSATCNDPAMTPIVDQAAPALKAAGLTKLRCLEQSGTVVSDRDL